MIYSDSPSLFSLRVENHADTGIPAFCGLDMGCLPEAQVSECVVPRRVWKVGEPVRAGASLETACP